MTNIGTHSPVFRNEHQLAAHTHCTSYVKIEPTTHNIHKSYTHSAKTKPTHQQNVSNITTTVIEQQYV
jgi:Tfp pilus assembly protein PilE